MNPAIVTLLNKEISQHRVLFLWLGAFALVTTLLLVFAMERLGAITSYLSIASLFTEPVLVVIAVILGQQLIVKEYYGRSQRFIEALPVARGQMEWVKFGVGYAVLLAIALAVWAWCVSLASQHEHVSGSFAALMATRICVYVFALWCIVYTFSFLGRLRIGFAGASLLAVYMLDAYTPLEVGRFGPLALMDPDLFASERDTLPARAILETLVIAGAALGLARLLLRLREGSLVETLSVAMSMRDKSFVLVLAVVAIGSASLLGDETADLPFSVGQQNVITRGIVEVAHLEAAYATDAVRHADALALHADQLTTVVTLPDEFRIGVTFAPQVLPMQYDRVRSSPRYGVLTSTDVSRHADQLFFAAFVFHEVFDELMHGRTTSIETLHVFHDGFALYWAAHGASPPPALTTPVPGPLVSEMTPETLLVYASYAARQIKLDPTRIGEWDRTMEELGDGLSLSLNYSLWRVLAEEVGHDTLMAFARSLYARQYHRDARDWYLDWRNPATDQFETTTGIAWPDFVGRWARQLETLATRPGHQHALANIPDGTMTVVPVSDGLGVSLNLTADLDPGLVPNSTCQMLHTGLPAYETTVSARGLRGVDIKQGSDNSRLTHSIFGAYGSGDRVAVSLECMTPNFPVPLRLGFVRIEIP